MDNRTVGFLLIVTAVVALSAAQLTIKARLSVHGTAPLGFEGLIRYLWGLAGDWRVWLGFVGLVVSSVLWYLAVSRLPLSLAYPFAALSYPVIFLGSLWFLRETFSWQVALGNLVIIIGVLLVAGSNST